MSSRTRYIWLCGKNYAHLPMHESNMALIRSDPQLTAIMLEEVSRAMPPADHKHDFDMEQPMAMSDDDNIFYDCKKGSSNVEPSA